jgi:hypothetical protein
MLSVGLLAFGEAAWLERNVSLFGTAGDGRDGIALSTREVFDHMTPEEHKAAWLWWFRGPGAGYVKKHFPKEAWERHEWYAPGGFYIEGQIDQPKRITDALQAEGMSAAQSMGALKHVVAKQILNNLPRYLATMPVLFYRGLWFDEYMAIGFPALIVMIWIAVTRLDARLLIVLAPGVWSLVIYPAISLNLARYQFPVVSTSAIAVALFLPWITAKFRRAKSLTRNERRNSTLMLMVERTAHLVAQPFVQRSEARP